MSDIGEFFQSKIRPPTELLPHGYTAFQMRAIAKRNGCKYAEPPSAATLAHRNYMKLYMQRARAKGKWKGVGKYIRKRRNTC